MVFCRECKKKVDVCEHFVAPLGIPGVPVFDPKIKTLAYNARARVLEIAFKSGQTGNLVIEDVTRATAHNCCLRIKPEIYDTLLNQTLSSFLKFVAHRYEAAPVRPSDPPSQPCPACNRPMSERHRTTGGTLRILWHCDRCNQSFWHSYATESVRERKQRWH
jgi:hypothetical protein